ncbi:DUF4097 domain-containing protein [bacterium]|nr:DUF4097 domain-containing protein [bacterium]MCI0606734.1 DUF4097 domain-containing protein [bacterium]
MKAKLIFTIILLIVSCSVFAVEKHKHDIAGETKTQTFQVGKGGTLEVSISAGDILVSSWEKSEVFVKAEGIDPDELQDLKMSQIGNNVRVSFRPEWGSHHVRFTIQIPVDYNTDLHTSGGDLQLQGNFRGTIEGSTSGGDIRLGDVQGRVELSTSGGDVIAGKVTGTANLRTSGGDIRMTNCSGDVDMSTSGGNIAVGNVGKTLVARTAGGDIEVGDVGGEATVSTAGGEIRIGKVTGSVTAKTAGGDIELRGGSGLIRAKTAGGNINLSDLTGSVEASTAGGDVKAELRPSGKGRSRLSSSGGDVIIYLPANAKANIDALIDIRGRWEEDEYQILSDFKPDSYDKNPDSKEVHATYTLNGGGESIWLETVNGNIHIRTLR